jgi:hypothetical protein
MILGRILRAGRKAGIGFGEGLHSFEEFRLILRMVDAMNGKAEQPAAIRFGQIEAEQNHIGPGDGMHFKASIRLSDAHKLPLIACFAAIVRLLCWNARTCRVPLVGAGGQRRRNFEAECPRPDSLGERRERIAGEPSARRHQPFAGGAV